MVSARNGGLPIVGITFEYKEAHVWNRTGATLAVGELVMFDIKATDGDSSVAAIPGANNSPYANVITPVTVGLGTLSGAGAPDPGYMFGVVCDLLDGGGQGQTPGADNKLIKVCLVGYVYAKMADTAASGARGDVLVAADAVRTLTTTTAAGKKILGRVDEDVTTANALARILFDGINGFGQLAAS